MKTKMKNEDKIYESHIKKRWVKISNGNVKNNYQLKN